MSLKKKTKDELVNRINELENVIKTKGIGSDYVQKAEKIQRDVNLGLLIGGATALLGFTAYSILKSEE